MTKFALLEIGLATAAHVVEAIISLVNSLLVIHTALEIASFGGRVGEID